MVSIYFQWYSQQREKFSSSFFFFFRKIMLGNLYKQLKSTFLKSTSEIWDILILSQTLSNLSDGVLSSVTNSLINETVVAVSLPPWWWNLLQKHYAAPAFFKLKTESDKTATEIHSLYYTMLCLNTFTTEHCACISKKADNKNLTTTTTTTKTDFAETSWILFQTLFRILPLPFFQALF